MNCIKVSFSSDTTEYENRLTNIYVKMGLIIDKTGDQEYTIYSKEEEYTIDNIIYLSDSDIVFPCQIREKMEIVSKTGLETVSSFCRFLAIKIMLDISRAPAY